MISFNSIIIIPALVTGKSHVVADETRRARARRRQRLDNGSKGHSGKNQEKRLESYSYGAQLTILQWVDWGRCQMGYRGVVMDLPKSINTQFSTFLTLMLHHSLSMWSYPQFDCPVLHDHAEQVDW